jgi:hypothetical protein
MAVGQHLTDNLLKRDPSALANKDGSNLPLEAATKDVITRYKKGSDMLASAAIALRRLKERVDAGCGSKEYRAIHLEPYISQRWINVQLRLAPPGAAEEQIASNVETHHEDERLRLRKLREARAAATASGKYVLPTSVTTSTKILWSSRSTYSPGRMRVSRSRIQQTTSSPPWRSSRTI